MSGPPPSDKPEYVLFILRNCEYCNNFGTKLKSKPELFKKFNIVDIETIPAVPDEVDEVPFIYDGKQVFRGAECFKWLEEKMSEFLSAANDGLMYSFVDGNEETIFNNYSLLDQQNGSHGIGNSPVGGNASGTDPTRMTVMNDTPNKNSSLDSLVAMRNSELKKMNM
jgi:hypothetical protein